MPEQTAMTTKIQVRERPAEFTEWPVHEAFVNDSAPEKLCHCVTGPNIKGFNGKRIALCGFDVTERQTHSFAECSEKGHAFCGECALKMVNS